MAEVATRGRLCEGQSDGGEATSSAPPGRRVEDAIRAVPLTPLELVALDVVGVESCVGLVRRRLKEDGMAQVQATNEQRLDALEVRLDAIIVRLEALVRRGLLKPST